MMHPRPAVSARFRRVHCDADRARDWRLRWRPRLERATRYAAWIITGIALAMAAMSMGLQP
ncbi:hypothetical protein [Stakelama tenebrarum]|uniref:Uncharacterized protein n=1 Tax=Stakelama tenebrarum TaxID=2711215 RepID=A0A6G6Y4X9_9SPHN|nr:hypothetical protein [Sphingosinithalassobacter tenebrarum]QIG79960.1 hypothetical protein G5C33_09355 [Sphingosinithalassobacter tenebrarum]